MSSAILQGGASGSGQMTLLAPNTNSNRTVTFPDVDGQAMVSAGMPAFSAFGYTDQVISANTDTKVILNSKQFDTAGAFDSATNYRFTPQVAGYYQFSGEIEFYSTSSIGVSEAKIYKNGSEYSRNVVVGVSGSEAYVAVNRCIYLNGTTDYIELYARCSSGGTITLYGSTIYKYLTGVLVRAA